MITLAQAKVGEVYAIESAQADAQTKRHLNNLGVVAGQAVVLINCRNQNDIVLLHNGRIALTDTILQAIHVEGRSTSEKVWASLDISKVRERATIVGIYGQGAMKCRLMDTSLAKGTVIFIRKVVPLADPIKISVCGYELTLQESEVELVLVEEEEGE